MRRLTTEEFIKKAKEIHGDKYDYSKVNYINAQTKVCIICPIHGEFWVKPNTHLKGNVCIKCSHNYSPTTEEWIARCVKKHGGRYDYSKVVYKKGSDKVCIICPEHGEFWQIARNHERGDNCPKCGKISSSNKQRFTNKIFIEKAQEKHGFIYDYSKVNYTSALKKVTIICPKHGEFTQNAEAHMKGQGCPRCAQIKSNDSKKLTKEMFITKAKKLHGDKYDYSNVNYINYDNYVKIICPNHGKFLQTPDSHLQGKGCPKCGRRLSLKEDEIYDFIKNNLNCEIKKGYRKLIYPYELDIFIPSKNIAIEYNGLLWHSMKYKNDKNCHLNKLNLCNEKGVKLIQIFEDEYVNKKEIVHNKLKHILGITDDTTKIMARKCEIVEINKNVAKLFLDENHIQGFSSSTIYLGAYHNKILIGVMSFKCETKTSDKWELTRYATKLDTICQGLGSKLFIHFTRLYKPSEVKSFADRRWTIDVDNNLYTKIGFKLDKILNPDYHYIKPNEYERFHKFNFRKQTLHKKYGFPLTMTETEMVKELKAYKIYDCGLLKYVWKNLDI